MSFAHYFFCWKVGKPNKYKRRSFYPGPILTISEYYGNICFSGWYIRNENEVKHNLIFGEMFFFVNRHGDRIMWRSTRQRKKTILVHHLPIKSEENCRSFIKKKQYTTVQPKKVLRNIQLIWVVNQTKSNIIDKSSEPYDVKLNKLDFVLFLTKLYWTFLLSYAEFLRHIQVSQWL